MNPFWGIPNNSDQDLKSQCFKGTAVFRARRDSFSDPWRVEILQLNVTHSLCGIKSFHPTLCALLNHFGILLTLFIKRDCSAKHAG